MFQKLNSDVLYITNIYNYHYFNGNSDTTIFPFYLYVGGIPVGNHCKYMILSFKYKV
jgi:hypothetical protein